MAAVNLITQAEYARRRGVAKSAVNKAVKEGRIVLIDGLVDPDVADIQWQKNTRGRVDSGKSTTAGDDEAPAAPLHPDQPGHDGDYFKQRSRRERLEADLAERKLAELNGDLVRVAEVRAEMGKRIGQVRSNLLQIPARLAPLLAHETDQAKIHAMLDAELRTVLLSTIRGEHGRD